MEDTLPIEETTGYSNAKPLHAPVTGPVTGHAGPDHPGHPGHVPDEERERADEVHRHSITGRSSKR